MATITIPAARRGDNPLTVILNGVTYAAET